MAFKLLLLLLWVFTDTVASNRYIVKTFEGPIDRGIFNKLVINRETNELFLGTVNYLYKLNPELEILQEVQTGPQKDDPKCSILTNLTCEGNCNCKLMMYYTKALVIDYTNQKLIICSTLFHGQCERRHLDNITVKDEVSFIPIVANNATASTVMFIAPGPAVEKGEPQPEVLYVAASYTRTGLPAYRDKVPAYCSRSLTDFNLVYKGLINFRTSAIEIESQHRDTFIVRYVYGFGSENFSYVLTIQKASVLSSGFITKIARVCQNDKNYYSYAEVGLSCKDPKTNLEYNLVQSAHVGRSGTKLARELGIPTTEDVLYAVFSKGDPNSVNPTGTSAMCVYSLRGIRKKFTENIQQCFSGIGNTGPDHIISSNKCIAVNVSITDDYCGDEYNFPVSGTKDIKAKPLLQYTNTFVTSIVTATTYNYTVAFVGTKNGHIKKVAVESNATEYKDIAVEEGSPIYSDLRLDEAKQYLYAVTERKITKLKVHDCSQYKTCYDCLGAKDPFCGWCSFEDKERRVDLCSARIDCQIQDSSMRWLSYSGQQCTNITKVQPDKIQKGRDLATPEVKVFIDFLPQFQEGELNCVFSSYDNGIPNRPKYIIETKATLMREADGVRCVTPIPNKLPPIPTGRDHIVMRLSVQSKKKDVVSTNFTFFDCGDHSSCTSCTLSNFPCTWCVQTHICTFEPDQDCQGLELVTGTQTLGISEAPGPKSCPRIEIANNMKKILVPANKNEEISVKAINLYKFQMQQLKCLFNLKDGQEVKALITNNSDNYKVTCAAVEFDYIPNIKSQNVPFQIFWEGEKALDNPTNIQVLMYKCEVMANSCGECLALEEQYKCGWCKDRCSTEEWCLDKSLTWLPTKISVCPDPQISSITPTSGPLEGGTRITIIGKDMGQKQEDISVKVGSKNCDIIEFTPPKRVVCSTPSYTQAQTTSVFVNVSNLYKTSGNHFFHYVKLSITDIHPKKGPVSGGTKVTISGQHMNAGSSAKVMIGNLQCDNIERLNQSDMMCTTTKSKHPQTQAAVNVIIDKQTIDVPQQLSYEYVEDPKISGIDPKKSIQAGGITITVYGENIDSVLSPTMVFPDEKNPIEAPCEVKTNTRMICQSPPVDMVTGEKYDEISFGFIMDGVEEVRNLTVQYDDYGTFQVFPNPIFTQFPNGVKSHQNKNEYLTIDGENINSAVQREDVKVKIGQEFCNVTSVAATQLTCTPPKSQPAALKGNGFPEVVVFVGANFSSKIGELRYEEPDVLSLQAIIGISVGAAILVVAVIAVLIAYLVKSRRSDDMMKKMRIQMDNLESRVANECKEAFAELQTDMTELTSDNVGQVSIPFWDYRTFCMKVLFPGHEDHMVVRELQVDIRHNREDIERGLQQFFQLISNKTFLLIFIRTLESNRNFQLKDRVNVASLISVALQTKMEYATDILKTLLADLIEKSVEGLKNHPKLLLRRNESVAEKMLTNWFTFLLYRFMKDCAGEPLFMLYQAMKQQVSKGPVDAITSEARYSLSEDKLIRQQIQYKNMTVHVVDVDSLTQQTHPVKVLDCDTISQVKEKILDAIYKNAPFSSRPLKDNLDLVYIMPKKLEWLNPSNEKVQGYLPSQKDTHRLVLHDEDHTSKMESDCRRLNTLSHYKVPDGAYVALEIKTTYNSSIMSDRSLRFDNLSFYNNRSPSLNRTTSPQSIHVDVDNVKSYHLVRHHDSDIQKEGDRGSKMVSEIYLPRLLVTKGTLQQFVDDLFERIFSTAHRGNVLPLAIKYMFDFLDDQALLHNIQDNETVHTWKSNSLPLRFWVNVMKNPNFVFDIYKSNIVDSCLSVVAQTFMDSCSVHEHVLGKDSPSSKLLYAKEIPKYKQWVDRYYQDIKMMPAISDQDMTAMLTDESRVHQQEFNTNAALYELYKYVLKNYNELMESLDEDEFARRSKLRHKLEKVKAAMDGDAVC
ncbi:plexin-A4 isoform X3 [Patella vulgata]|uniref:plexin-A4 isoform X3 n=1 Tax=Patella vulgata TaxID=6465 RepID=UPI0021802E56|nr:plexin-A4 isoform X3 [Patella vulgata]